MPAVTIETVGLACSEWGKWREALSMDWEHHVVSVVVCE